MRSRPLSPVRPYRLLAVSAAAVMLSGCIEVDTALDVSLRDDGMVDAALTVAVDGTLLYETAYLPMVESGAGSDGFPLDITEDSESEVADASDAAGADVADDPLSGVLSYEQFMWEEVLGDFDTSESFCLDFVGDSVAPSSLTSSDRYVSSDSSAYGFVCRFGSLPPSQVAPLIADDSEEFSLELVQTGRGWSVSGSLDSDDLFGLGEMSGMSGADAAMAGVMVPSYTLSLAVSAPGELVSNVGGSADGTGRVVWGLSGSPAAFSAEWEEPRSLAVWLWVGSALLAAAGAAAFLLVRRRSVIGSAGSHAAAASPASEAAAPAPFAPPMYPAGWYPAQDGRMYYWDGSGWTGHVSDPPSAGPGAPGTA